MSIFSIFVLLKISFFILKGIKCDQLPSLSISLNENATFDILLNSWTIDAGNQPFYESAPNSRRKRASPRGNGNLPPSPNVNGQGRRRRHRNGQRGQGQQPGQPPPFGHPIGPPPPFGFPPMGQPPIGPPPIGPPPIGPPPFGQHQDWHQFVDWNQMGQQGYVYFDPQTGQYHFNQQLPPIQIIPQPVPPQPQPPPPGQANNNPHFPMLREDQEMIARNFRQNTRRQRGRNHEQDVRNLNRIGIEPAVLAREYVWHFPGGIRRINEIVQMQRDETTTAEQINLPPPTAQGARELMRNAAWENLRANYYPNENLPAQMQNLQAYSRIRSNRFHGNEQRVRERQNRFQEEPEERIRISPKNQKKIAELYERANPGFADAAENYRNDDRRGDTTQGAKEIPEGVMEGLRALYKYGHLPPAYFAKNYGVEKPKLHDELDRRDVRLYADPKNLHGSIKAVDEQNYRRVRQQMEAHLERRRQGLSPVPRRRGSRTPSPERPRGSPSAAAVLPTGPSTSQVLPGPSTSAPISSLQLTPEQHQLLTEQLQWMQHVVGGFPQFAGFRLSEQDQLIFARRFRQYRDIDRLPLDEIHYDMRNLAAVGIGPRAIQHGFLQDDGNIEYYVRGIVGRETSPAAINALPEADEARSEIIRDLAWETLRNKKYGKVLPRTALAQDAPAGPSTGGGGPFIRRSPSPYLRTPAPQIPRPSTSAIPPPPMQITPQQQLLAEQQRWMQHVAGDQDLGGYRMPLGDQIIFADNFRQNRNMRGLSHAEVHQDMANLATVGIGPEAIAQGYLHGDREVGDVRGVVGRLTSPPAISALPEAIDVDRRTRMSDRAWDHLRNTYGDMLPPYQPRDHLLGAMPQGPAAGASTGRRRGGLYIRSPSPLRTPSPVRTPSPPPRGGPIGGGIPPPPQFPPTKKRHRQSSSSSSSSSSSPRAGSSKMPRKHYSPKSRKPFGERKKRNAQFA